MIWAKLSTTHYLNLDRVEMVRFGRNAETREPFALIYLAGKAEAEAIICRDRAEITALLGALDYIVVAPDKPAQ